MFVSPLFLHSFIRPSLSLSDIPYSSPHVPPSFFFFFLVNLSLIHSSVCPSVRQSVKSVILCLFDLPHSCLQPFPLLLDRLLVNPPTFTRRPSVCPSVCLSVSLFSILFTGLFSILPSLIITLSSVCQPPPLLVRPSVGPSSCQSFRPSVSQSVTQPITLSVHPSVSQSVSQSARQSVSQSVSQSVRPSVRQSVQSFPFLRCRLFFNPCSFPRPSDSLSFNKQSSYFERHICRPSDAILQVQ